MAHYTAWARPVIDQSRVWYPTEAHANWLKGFVNLPPIPVYYESLGKYVTVTVRELVKVLEDALTKATPLVWKDYRTKTMIRLVATPNSYVYTRDPLSEAILTPLSAAPASVVPSNATTHPSVAKAVTSSMLSERGYVRESLKAGFFAQGYPDDCGASKWATRKWSLECC